MSLIAVLRKSDPRGRQLPAALDRHLVKFGSRVCHCAVEVSKLAVGLDRELKRLPHCLVGIVRQSEYVIADHVYAGSPDFAYYLQNFRRAKATLLDAIAHMLASRFDAESEPPETCAPQFL